MPPIRRGGVRAAPRGGTREILLRYGGWSLVELRDSEGGQQLMWEQNWYERNDWSRESLPAGLYRLRVLVPGSTGKTFDEQQALLQDGEDVAPTVLVAAALICLRLRGAPDPLQGGWMCCREQASAVNRVALVWYGGRLRVGGNWAGARHPFVWASAVRTS